MERGVRVFCLLVALILVISPISAAQYLSESENFDFVVNSLSKFESPSVVIMTLFSAALGKIFHSMITSNFFSIQNLFSHRVLPFTGAVVSLPQNYVDTTMPPRTGQVINVNAGGNLQQAIDSAQPGDTIVLQAGAVFQTAQGFRLRAKSNPQNKWITITSSAEALLPTDTQRVNPAIHSQYMPVIEATSSQPYALLTESGASYYRIIGVQFRPVAGRQVIDTLIWIGSQTQPESSVSQLPHDIVFDRVMIMGDPILGGKRGMMINGRRIGIINSYFDDWKYCGHDGGTAIGVFNTDGIIKVVNNQISASGIGFLTGGATAPLATSVADLEIRQNYFYKKASWTSGAPCGSWPAKNAFELKVGQRVLIEGNVFDGNWLAAQAGQIILLKADQFQSISSPGVGHITFRHNIIRNTGSGINMVGYDDNGFGTQLGNLNNVLIENNIMYALNEPPFTSSASRLFEFQNGGAFRSYNVTLQHNTFVDDTGVTATLAMNTDYVSGLVMRNNIFSRGTYGIFASCGSEGTGALNCGAPGSIVQKNVFIGAPSGMYPANNFYPSNSVLVGFTDLANKNFALTSSSPYKNSATDGTDVGANITLLNQMTYGTVSGIWGACTDTTWSPAQNLKCGSFTQVSNCGNTRSASGSLICGGSTPVCSSANVCVQCTQTSQCATGQACLGNICVTPSPAPTNPNPGLLVAYNFSENTGTTTTDYSGNGRTGTLTGTSWVPGKTGSALSFNGANSDVVVSDFNSPSTITIEFWMYPTATGERQVIAKATSEYDARIVGSPVNRMQIRFGTASLRDNGVDFSINSNLNKWYHYAYTYNSITGDFKIYRDGIIVNSGNALGVAPIDTTEILHIGKHPSGSGTFSGVIDDVRIWNIERTQSEIQADMGSNGSVPVPPTPTPTPPVCGNGILQTGEQCDKGAQNGVVCNAAYGSSCTYCSITCTNVTVNGPRCGDGSIQSPQEQCDDGNTVSGDGCSSSCLIETVQSQCVFTSSAWSKTSAVAGDTVNLNVQGINCVGKAVNFIITEQDCVIGVCSSTPITTITGTFPSTSWKTVWVSDSDGADSDPEYVFKAVLATNASVSATSGQLTVSPVAAPPSCQDTTWLPSESTLCGTVYQTSNCGNTRTVTGAVQCTSGQRCRKNVCIATGKGWKRLFS